MFEHLCRLDRSSYLEKSFIGALKKSRVWTWDSGVTHVKRRKKWEYFF